MPARPLLDLRKLARAQDRRSARTIVITAQCNDIALISRGPADGDRDNFVNGNDDNV